MNTTQLGSWQRTTEMVEEDGRHRQMRLFTDRHKEVAAAARPGDEFWQRVLDEEVGAVPWEEVVEFLAVNCLIAPRRELSIHEKWFPQTAMAALLDQ